jgi:hypothetical protein
VDNSLSLLKLRRFCYRSHKLYNVALVAFEKRETPDKTRVSNYNIQKEQIVLVCYMN